VTGSRSARSFIWFWWNHELVSRYGFGSDRAGAAKYYAKWMLFLWKYFSKWLFLKKSAESFVSGSMVHVCTPGCDKWNSLGDKSPPPSWIPPPPSLCSSRTIRPFAFRRFGRYILYQAHDLALIEWVVRLVHVWQFQQHNTDFLIVLRFRFRVKIDLIQAAPWLRLLSNIEHVRDTTNPQIY
jgi:hypothetical protein